MRTWPFWQLVLVWFLVVVVLAGVTVLDLTRAREFAIATPSFPIYRRFLHLVRGLWKVAPIASVALLAFQ